MSQEYGSTPRRNRRTTRGQRNRPVLVTASDIELQSSLSAEETATAVEEPLYEATPLPIVETTTRPRRLPRFFSTVGKNEKEGASETQEKETIAQARLARATRGKSPAAGSKGGTPEKALDTKQVEKSAKPASSSPSKATPARSPSPFKTRYIFGMLIYIVGSTFLSSVELSFMSSNHLDTKLTTLNLFGLSLPISTFTLVYLATLVLLLVILAYFDFLPRGFTSASNARAGQRQAQRGAAQKSKPTEVVSEGPRAIPPPVRQGVKGADDDLYQEYRLNQRRDKKR